MFPVYSADVNSREHRLVCVPKLPGVLRIILLYSSCSLVGLRFVVAVWFQPGLLARAVQVDSRFHKAQTGCAIRSSGNPLGVKTHIGPRAQRRRRGD